MGQVWDGLLAGDKFLGLIKCILPTVITSHEVTYRSSPY